MQLTTVMHENSPRYGLVEDGSVRLSQGDDGNLAAALRRESFAAIVTRLRQEGGPQVPFPQVLPPLLGDPARCICVGLNYRDHVEEMSRKAVGHPTLFVRFFSSFVGAGQNLVKPAQSEMYDYEGELAVVIGRSGREIPKERALDHVAGYTCVNDGSVRDWQAHSTQFTAGKNFEQSAAIGPVLVGAETIPNPHALQLETRLNGRVMQRSGCDVLIFDIPTLIHYISQFMRLHPGDVISTGTPSGVGMGRSPQVFMQAGDVVEVELSEVGCLKNPVVSA